METQFIKLNMIPSGINPCFHVSQYDIGRSLGFMIYNGSEVVDLDSYTCTIEATRSDGVAITTSVATDDNVGTFETTTTMTNKADKYKAQFVIVDGDSNRIASLPFDMEVIKAAMDENAESIEEDASLYQQYTEAVQGAIAEANADIQAEENARIAAVNAEATARANADTTLQNNIDAEATARQTADNTLQGNINSEAATRASADSNLQSQINQIVAPTGEAPNPSEITNARIGADGTVYDTLGNAIRGQVSDLKSTFDQSIAMIGWNYKNNITETYPDKYWSGTAVGATISLNSTSSHDAVLLPIDSGTFYLSGSYFRYVHLLDADKKLLSVETSGAYTKTVDNTSGQIKYMALTISPDTEDDLVIYKSGEYDHLAYQGNGEWHFNNLYIDGSLTSAVRKSIDGSFLGTWLIGASMEFENGGFDGSGINSTASNRIRSKGYYNVVPGHKYRFYAVDTSGLLMKISISFYSADDYTTARISASDWATTVNEIVAPDNGNYARFIVAKTNDTTLTVDNLEGVYLIDLSCDIPSSVMAMGVHKHSDSSDNINSLTIPGLYSYAGVSLTNAPESISKPAFIEVWKWTNGVVYQKFTYIETAKVYLRFLSVNNTWTQWILISGQTYPTSNSNGLDLNTCVTDGKYTYGGISTVNGPWDIQNSPFKLIVDVWTSGVVEQKIIYPLLGVEFNRIKNLVPKWTDWKICGELYYMSTNHPVIAKKSFINAYYRSRTDVNMQDIAIYGGHIFELFEDEFYVDSSSTAIESKTGHGNNGQFGTTLHGDFPYLYCGSWTKDDCKVYVNQVTTSSSTLVRTIDFSTLSGYLNCCVDEDNGKIFIFLCTSSSTETGDIDFIVADLSTGNIISRETLTEKIPIIQGMEFHDGRIYVTSGNGSTYTNRVSIYDTDGKLISKTDDSYIGAEIEGISFDGEKMVIASWRTIMY